MSLRLSALGRLVAFRDVDFPTVGDWKSSMLIEISTFYSCLLFLYLFCGGRAVECDHNR